MLRRVGAILAGLFAGFVIVGTIQMISGYLYPPPDDLNFHDKEGILIHMQSLPTMAFVIVILAHVIGTFVGAFISARITDAYKFYFGLFVGALFVVATISNLLMMPHPTWMIGTDILLTIGAAYLGARIGSRPKI